MYRTLFIPLLAVLFILSGCGGNSNNGTTEQPMNELTELRSQVSSLQQQLDTKSNNNEELQYQLNTTRDSLRQTLTENDSLIQRVQEVEAQLEFARAEFKKAFAAFDETIEECRAVKDEYAADRSQLRTENRKLWGTISIQAGELIEANTAFDASQKWKGHYKKIAKRNIFKHMFGAGKPSPPDVPEPGY